MLDTQASYLVKMIYRKQLDYIFSPTTAGWLDESSLLLWLSTLTKLNSICFSFSSHHLSQEGSCQVKNNLEADAAGGLQPLVWLPGLPQASCQKVWHHLIPQQGLLK